jgi:hypothetical protein
MEKFSALKKYSAFLFFVVATVLVTYFTSPTISSAWYVLLLVLYYRSKDEAFWLAFFFVTTDGFVGFLGIYTTLIKLIPGLPGIELAQFYIILSLFKAYSSGSNSRPFYGKWLVGLLIYCLFLVLFGILNGLDSDTNVYFRLVKIIMPLFLFYSIPRLLRTQADYQQLFRYLFLVLLMAFLAQLNTMFTGFDPKERFGRLKDDGDPRAPLEVGRNFRVLYNQGISFFCLFGALYFLALKKLKIFRDSYLYLVVILTFALTFLSATRGYILSIGLVIFLFFLFVQRLNMKRVFAFSVFLVSLILLGLSNPTVSTQMQFSIDRLLTLNALADGDISAEGSLIRLSERGPSVMKVWSESPVFGHGFSNKFFKNDDFHVGNQNLLMHAGIVGIIMLYGFFFYFMLRMLTGYFNSASANPYSSTFLVFNIFLVGWIIVHSTSSQQFAFYGLPNDIFPQAIFLGLAGLTCREARSHAAKV